MADDDLRDQRRDWPRLTVQGAALLAFMGLALGIAIIAIGIALFAEPQRLRTDVVTNVIQVLLIAMAVCGIFAWLNPANTGLLARGFKHVLSIQRAAVGSFGIASAATVAILIFIALSAMFSTEVEHGLYLLAAIEFLLKLAAISAIIVLITMRRPAQVVVNPAEAAPVVVDEPERGRLEFGSLTFAFGLVVIAGLVVPTDDLMRLANMFFGGEKTVEDYLPQRSVVTVEDGLSEVMVDAIEDIPWLSAQLAVLSSQERNEVALAIQAQIESVLYGVEVENAKRVGAWPLLEAICYGRHDTMIFANSDNKVLAEHLAYLSVEGLVEYPYADVNAIELTRHGALAMSKYLDKNSLPACDLPDPLRSETASTDIASPVIVARVSRIDPDEVEQTISGLSTVQEIEISSGTVFRLSLPAGNYRASLQAIGSVDPFLQLFDANGELVDENDDGGFTGAFDSELRFTIVPGGKYYLRASSYDGRQGIARLLVQDASIEIDPTVDFSAQQIAREVPATPLGEVAVVPPDGASFSYQATETGEHTFSFLPETASDQTGIDLVGVLFRRDGDRLTEIASDDDGGTNGLYPLVTASLEEGKDYILVLKHFESLLASQTSVVVTITTPSGSSGGQTAADAGAVDTIAPLPAETVEAPAAPPATLP
jgi:hypothetical protein